MKKNVDQLLLVLDEVMATVDPTEGVTKNMLLASAAESESVFFDRATAEKVWRGFHATLDVGGTRHVYVTDGRMRRSNRRQGRVTGWEKVAQERADLDGYEPYAVRLKDEIEKQDFTTTKRGKKRPVEGEELWSFNIREALMKVASFSYSDEQEAALVELIKVMATEHRDMVNSVKMMSAQLEDRTIERDRWATSQEKTQRLLMLTQHEVDTREDGDSASPTH